MPALIEPLEGPGKKVDWNNMHAGIAIDQELIVQDVPFDALRTKLEAAQQIVRPEAWKRPQGRDKDGKRKQAKANTTE